MEAQNSLTRIRSSIHSLSSMNEISSGQEEDIEEQKFHKPGSPPVQPGSTRFIAFLAVTLVFFYSFFFYFNTTDLCSSENLLLTLIFIAISLYFAAKNQNSILRNFTAVKNLCSEYTVILGLRKSNSKPVQWFIGEGEVINKKKREKVVSKIEKEGVEFYSNGDFYEGEFHEGKCNGSGVYNYFVNGRYEGDWIEGKYDGNGIESWARGSRYRGQYRQGLRHGFGVYRFYTGDSYAGEWFNGQSHGIGAQICGDGSCFVGEFKCGSKHGFGCYHFRNGDKYAGEYFGDKIHGFGVYQFANGHCYEGSWHEGRKQGYGMYTFRNGDTKSGEWDAGNLRTSYPPQTPAVLRAVQAARKTSENAIHLRRVDDQVNKAVTAANRAATAARVAAIRAVHNRIEGEYCDPDS